MSLDEILAHCPGCQARVKVPAAGKYMCPKCGRIFVIDASTALAAAPSEPAPVSEPRTPPTSPTPRSALDCENHPGVAATAVCQGCGKLVCADCFTAVDGRNLCRVCAAPRSRAEAPTTVAWESEGSAGFFRGLGSALVEPLIRPAKFYGAMSPRDHVWRAFTFGLGVRAVVSLLALVIEALTFRALDVQQVFNQLAGQFPVLKQFQPQIQGALDAVTSSMSGPRLALAALLVPFSAAGALLLEALVVHLFLLLFGAAKNGLEATLKVSSYASPASALSLLPGVGGVVYFVWKAVILVIGLSEAHRINRGRSAAAVLTPLGLVVLFLLIGAGIAVAGLLAAFAHGGLPFGR